MALLLVVVMVFVLVLVGLHRSRAVSHTGMRTARALKGDLAQLAAESAVEEMMARVKSALNDPEHPLFEAIRAEVYAGQSGRLLLSEHLELSALEELLGEESADGVSLTDWTAEVAYQRQFEDLPYERFGLLLYSARATAAIPGGETVARRVSIGQGFKVVLATLPRPFEQTALFVADGSSLTDADRISALRRRALGEVDVHRRLIDRAMAVAPASLLRRYQDVRTFIPSDAELEERVPEWPIGPDHFFFAVGTEWQTYPLNILDLEGELSRAEVESRDARRAAESALAAVEAAPESREAHEQFLSALQDSLSETQGRLDRIWVFREAYQTLSPEEGDRYTAVRTELSRLGLDHWRRVAGFVLRDEPGRPAGGALQTLRQRLPVLNGVVLVEDAEVPLTVTGDIRGKLVLVVHGGTLVLRDTGAGARDRDLFTVVALGARVVVRGEVHATLALLPGGGEDGQAGVPSTLEMAPGATLHGGLVAAELPPEQARHGEVVRRLKYHSGSTTEESAEGASIRHYVVQVSPRNVFRKVERS